MIIIVIHQGIYGSLKKIEVSANDVNLRIDCSQSFKYKAVFVGKTADFDNGNSLFH